MLKKQKKAVRPALLKEAKTRILDYIKTRGLVSIDQIQCEIGLAKTTVKQHLVALEEQGLVIKDMADSGGRSGSKGRPKLVYRLSQSAAVLFPSKEPELLRELLDHLIASGRNDLVESFFQSYWEKRGAKFKERLKRVGRGKADKNKSSARAVLMEMLAEDGFMPQVSVTDGKETIRECNCPFPEAVKATQIPCRLEADFLRMALGQKSLERTSYMAHGASSCTYVLNKKIKKL